MNLANIKMLEELYASWEKDPESVDPSWKHFFEGMNFASYLPSALPARTESGDLRVFALINAYRTYGHLKVQSSPINTEDLPFPSELKLENFGLTEKDLNASFPTFGFVEKETAPLKDILASLEVTYCGRVGIEYMGYGEEIEKWIQSQIEPGFPTRLSNEDTHAIYRQLAAAEGFETFIHTKYTGQKRFSLEGAETLIPMLHAILYKGGEVGISHAFIGMAHRGRLNVLANILNKSYVDIFEEFEDYYAPDLSESTGDVKYHLGFSGTYRGAGDKEIAVTLAANPSHLESVDPVLEGATRALQEKVAREEQNQIIPIMIHGDGALAGQGVVYETMQMCQLNGYATKGTVHIVVNNQIGYTTLPKDGRSTRYCTDLAKAFNAPVFHVNAEDPEACVAATKLALHLRQKFGCEVFIDLYSYRKYGHNETDEPAFTQPLQYQIIREKKSIFSLYRESVMQRNILPENLLAETDAKTKNVLEEALKTVKSKAPEKPVYKSREKLIEDMLKPVETKVDENTLRALTDKFCSIPAGFNLDKKLQKLMEARKASLNEGLDWGMGELLAYASLAVQGVHVRLTGQDVRRGTFAHRHAIWVDQVTNDHYFPLSHLAENQAPCDFFNSHLSEYASMGFEWGYSAFYPQSLVLWEGQYGDFANGAQIIIDQYLSTSEMKWGQAVNLTLLLPHGYEGAGPEHSSARIERFLQLAGDGNMYVVNASTPAQMFHLLRRQALSPLKKPLIVFTPKALLRAPVFKSPLSDFANGQFEEVLDDPNPPQNPKRLGFCSGKIFYEVDSVREGSDLVLIRIEQLYPLNKEKIKALIDKYQGITEYLWIQEEHENMGAYYALRRSLKELCGKILTYVGRERAASPAAGSRALHKIEIEAMKKTLFGETK